MPSPNDPHRTVASMTPNTQPPSGADPEASSFPDTVAPGTRSGSVVRVREPAEVQEPLAVSIADPDHAGRYHLLDEIARGGMGAVLRGHDPSLGRDLAFKVLLPEHTQRAEVVER